MKKLFLVTILIALSSCKIKQKVTSEKNRTIDLIGFSERKSFNQEPYKGWFDENYKGYKSDSSSIASLKKEIKGITIKGFMGTWCGDSKREVPQFFKILDQIGFNTKDLELIAVNRNKKTRNNLQKGFNIKKVPTFIFFKQGKEIGRYVEYARESLEKDMLQIVSEKAYKHSYEN